MLYPMSLMGSSLAAWELLSMRPPLHHLRARLEKERTIKVRAAPRPAWPGRAPCCCAGPDSPPTPSSCPRHTCLPVPVRPLSGSLSLAPCPHGPGYPEAQALPLELGAA